MRGISWLPLRRWLSGTPGRRNAAKLRRAAKKQAQGYWTIVDEVQTFNAADLRPFLDMLDRDTTRLASVYEWSKPPPKPWPRPDLADIEAFMAVHEIEWPTTYTPKGKQ